MTCFISKCHACLFPFYTEHFIKGLGGQKALCSVGFDMKYLLFDATLVSPEIIRKSGVQKLLKWKDSMESGIECRYT